MCRLSLNLEASVSWNPQDLSRLVTPFFLLRQTLTPRDDFQPTCMLHVAYPSKKYCYNGVKKLDYIIFTSYTTKSYRCNFKCLVSSSRASNVRERTHKENFAWTLILQIRSQHSSNFQNICFVFHPCLLLSCFIISPFSHFNSFIFPSETIFRLLRYLLYFYRLFFSISPFKACPYFLHSPLLWIFKTKPFLLPTPSLLLMTLGRPKRPSGSQPKTMKTS